MTQPKQPTPLLNNTPAKQFRETINLNFHHLFNNLQDQLQQHQNLCNKVQEIKSTTPTTQQMNASIEGINKKLQALNTTLNKSNESLSEIFISYDNKINELQDQINDLTLQLSKPWYKRLLG